MEAIYAGSFDPITKGHLSVIERASKMFSKVIVLVANNQNKNHYYSLENREKFVKLATEHIDNVEVVKHNGVTADFINANRIEAVIRGVRSGVDMDYELKLEQFTRTTTAAETVYLSSLPEHSQVSSSLARMYLETGYTNLLKNILPTKVLENLN